LSAYRVREASTPRPSSGTISKEKRVEALQRMSRSKSGRISPVEAAVSAAKTNVAMQAARLPLQDEQNAAFFAGRTVDLNRGDCGESSTGIGEIEGKAATGSGE
jgi:hypothetical protein